MRLPVEIRLLIYEEVLCQRTNHSENANRSARPGHKDPVHAMDFALLRTCRLVYSETRYIFVRSATHHFEPGSFNIELYPLNISKQQYENLYHLHILLDADQPFPFNGHVKSLLQPHLQWRRVTMTTVLPPYSMRESEIRPYPAFRRKVMSWLTQRIYHATCQEVTLEMDCEDGANVEHHIYESEGYGVLMAKRDDVGLGTGTYGFPSKQYPLKLKRSDGSHMSLDLEYSSMYTWHDLRYTADVTTLRLCWRAKGIAKREYTSCDVRDCLDLRTGEEHRVQNGLPEGTLFPAVER